MAGREHTLDKSKIHYKWDNSLPPAIEIESGDVVHCQTEEVTDGQIKPGMPSSDSEQSGFQPPVPTRRTDFRQGRAAG